MTEREEYAPIDSRNELSTQTLCISFDLTGKQKGLCAFKRALRVQNRIIQRERRSRPNLADWRNW